VYRFLYRPRWILLHVLVVALIVAMINLMFWQIRRLHEKQAINAKIEQGARRAPLSLGQIEADVQRHGADAEHYRAVAATGTFDPAAEVTIRNRTLDGAPGRWVATPFVPSDGGPAVLVVRGWIPLSVDDDRPPISPIEPPAGEVTIAGYVEPTQTRGAFGPTDPPKGVLADLARVDVARFDRQYQDHPVAPGFFLQLTAQEPPTRATQIQPVPQPAPDEGPHRSYAWQWAIFTTIAAIGYPLALRRRAHSRGEAPGDDDGTDGGTDDGGTDRDGTDDGEGTARAGEGVGSESMALGDQRA
jgi:cytochrome oxidase assembly protein ShyY1